MCRETYQPYSKPRKHFQGSRSPPRYNTDASAVDGLSTAHQETNSHTGCSTLSEALRQIQGKVSAKPRPRPRAARDIPQRADCYPSRAPRTALSLLTDIPRGARPYPAPRRELALPFACPSHGAAPRAVWGLSPSLLRAAARRARASVGRGFGAAFGRTFGQFKKRSYLCSANGAGSRPRAIEIITRK